MTSSSDELVRLAKQRIRSGELPCRPMSRTWGSYGSGALCALCDRTIGPREIEYEVDTGEREWTLRFHLACHAVWQAECIRAGRVRADAR